MRWLLSGSVPIFLGMIFSFLGTAFIARMVGPSIFGEYVFILTWISIAGLLSKAGHDWVILKILPGRIAAGNLGHIKHVLLTCFRAVTIRATCAAFLLMMLSGLVGRWPESINLLIGFFLVLAIALAELRRTWALAYRAVWLSDAPENIVKSVLLVTGVSFFMAVNSDINANALLGLNLGATLLTGLAAGIYFTYRVTPEIFRVTEEVLPTHLANTKEIVRSMWLATAVNISLRNLDIVVVGLLVNAESTGLYAAASRLGQLAASPIMVLDKLAAPALAKAAELYDEDKISSVAKYFVLLASSGAAAILFVFLGFGEYIVGILFGSSYSPSLTAALVILAGNFGVALAGPANILMAVSGGHRESAMITSVTAVAHIILLVVLTALYGAIGAAVATASAIIIKAWVSAIWLYRAKGLNTTFTGLFE